ncbi:hypothetical protein L195_g034529, partial [Trifolium pratense]
DDNLSQPFQEEQSRPPPRGNDNNGGNGERGTYNGGNGCRSPSHKCNLKKNFAKRRKKREHATWKRQPKTLASLSAIVQGKDESLGDYIERFTK